MRLESYEAWDAPGHEVHRPMLGLR